MSLLFLPDQEILANQKNFAFQESTLGTANQSKIHHDLQSRGLKWQPDKHNNSKNPISHQPKMKDT